MSIIKNTVKFFKYKRILDKIYLDENIIDNLSKLFGVTFKKDWVGRIYAVLNPNIQNMEVETSKIIYEFDEKGQLSNNMFIEKWIMDRLNAASIFIKNNNLFDMVTYSIEKLDDAENYLFIIEPLPFKKFKKSLKISLILTVVLIILFCTYKIMF